MGTLVRRCLDTGEPLAADLHSSSVASVVLQLFLSLVSPVVPRSFQTKCSSVETFAEAEQLLHAFPFTNMKVFVYVIAFLRKLLTRSETNEASDTTLAVLFANVLFGLLPPSTKGATDDVVLQEADRK